MTSPTNILKPTVFPASVARLARLLVGVCLMFAAPLAALAQAPRSPTPAPVNGALAETVAKGFERPWALEFMPDGRMIVTERPGRVRIVERDGRVSKPLEGVPRVFARGQGGLLDVALDPRFAENRVRVIPRERRRRVAAWARGASRTSR
jgi:glucose/arabinose dehydrogenase